MSRPPTGSDRGFTLVELLISIAILGIIALPLSNVVIDYLRNTATTGARLSESHDEQIAAAYWQQDVSSLGVRSGWSSGSGTFPLQQSVNTAFPCSKPAGSTTVVTLSWNQYDTSGNATAISVAYVTTSAGGQLTLQRLHCTGTTLDSTATLAHYLTAVTVTCAGAAGSSCTGSGGNVPATISLKLTVHDLAASGQPYTVSLTGQRRQT